jgi:acetoacetyl-CoA synthetase
MSLSPPDAVLWHPSEDRNCNLARYQSWLSADQGLEFNGYADLYKWSVTELGAFWRSIVRYFEIQLETSDSTVVTGTQPWDAHWFPNGWLNYAEHLLRAVSQRGDSTVLVFRSETGERLELRGSELVRLVREAAAGLRAAGVVAGDRVAAILPNIPEAVIGLLATASVGAIWSNCPPEQSTQGLVDRLAQIEPKLLFAVRGYRYGGKWCDRGAVTDQVIVALPTLHHVVWIGSVSPPVKSIPDQRLWKEFLIEGDNSAPLRYEKVPFEHPLWILYSSGTTGKPKAIVHGHGGMLLEHLKALAFHLDLQPGDVFFWFTSASWMMWNWLVSGLAVGTKIVLYDGSPKYPNFSALWSLVEQEKVNYFGASAPFLAACQKAGTTPRLNFDLSSIRAIGTTGAPLSPEGFDWVYEQVKPGVWLGSVSGGTDVCTAFVLSNPLLPVLRGKLQCRGLGAPIEAWNSEGKPVWDEVGELVLTGPMPCMPVKFWNDSDRSRLKQSYFEHYPGIWRHGDWIEICQADGQCVIYGRSDSTLNRGGVRMGSSEVYRIVEALPEVLESLIIDTTGLRRDGSEIPGWLMLFLVLRPGCTLTPVLEQEITRGIRTGLSPRFEPDAIFPVTEIPHTLNGKKLEVPIKRLFQGDPLHKVVSRDALANPDCLGMYAGLAEQVLAKLTEHETQG